MKHVIVVGSGAGGATVAKKLQGEFAVTVLEAGKEFQPLALELGTIEKLKRTGLLFDEREMRLLFPALQIRKTRGMVLVNGNCLGGSTTVSTGNAVRMDRELQTLGINLDEEFKEIYQEIPITIEHQKRWHKHTRRLFEICTAMDLAPSPMPKMGDYDRCTSCGRCMLGCPRGAKWDSRRFVQHAVDRGAQVVTQCQVEKVVIQNGRAVGVEAKHRWTRRFFPADVVVLAAGGLATPVILQRSGITCEPRLFVDPVLCVATEWPDAQQCREIEMPFYVQREHFILSPYFDYLSFPFNKRWKPPAKDILGIMIKLADTPKGSVSAHGPQKTLSAEDKRRLAEAVVICNDILRQFGAGNDDIFLGTVNAGHPGGMLPLTERHATSMRDPRLPGNLYVADATLFPNSLGGPPILTIIAMAKKVSKACAERWSA